jgi:hypothetical protein
MTRRRSVAAEAAASAEAIELTWLRRGVREAVTERGTQWLADLLAMDGTDRVSRLSAIACRIALADAEQPCSPIPSPDRTNVDCAYAPVLHGVIDRGDTP